MEGRCVRRVRRAVGLLAVAALAGCGSDELVALDRVGSPDQALQPLSVDGLPVELGALKPLEDGGGMVLRAYELQGARGSVRLSLPGGRAADARLDLLERETGPPDLELRPFEVCTWRLRRASG
jgi:alpha-mannosidase